VVALDQADVLDLGADLDDGRRSLELEVLDQGHAVAVGEQVAEGVLPDLGFFSRLIATGLVPFVGAFGADVQITVLVGELGLAFRAGRQ
jgi:hypothetical protein